ncbi:MAG: hypothetical protein HQL24_04790 [Candidatus Omnitrophica bacterium]|nr:hypothetical protein [Candidatus Omnitrophota bacterium]
MNKERKNLLVFGYGLAVILSFIAIRLWIKHGISPIKIILLILAGIFFFISLIKVELIKPFYKKWMVVAETIGNIITHAIFIIIFTFIFSPVGIILRILKKDPLQEKIDIKAKSYWKKKVIHNKDLNRYQQQF